MNEKISIFDIISKVEDYWEGLNEKRKREILRYFNLIVFILIIVLSLILLIEKLTEKTTISELGILNTISTLETDRTYIVLQNGYISEGIKSSDITGLLLGETIKEYEVMDAFHELYSMAKNNEEHRTELVIPKGRVQLN